MKWSCTLFLDCLNIIIIVYTCSGKKESTDFCNLRKMKTEQTNTVSKEAEVQQTQAVHINLLQQ